MKRTILTLTALAALFSAAPVLQAHDHYDDLRGDVKKLWEWDGHLKDEARDHGDRHLRERLDGIAENLRRVEGELRFGGVPHDRIRDEIGDIRASLRRTSDELHAHGSRPGFTIQIR
jgi:hypothetical protein